MSDDIIVTSSLIGWTHAHDTRVSDVKSTISSKANQTLRGPLIHAYVHRTSKPDH